MLTSQSLFNEYAPTSPSAYVFNSMCNDPMFTTFGLLLAAKLTKECLHLAGRGGKCLRELASDIRDKLQDSWEESNQF